MEIQNWTFEVPKRETLAGDVARRRAWRKAVGWSALAACCVAGLLGFEYWCSQCPVEVVLERTDPSLMVDRSMIVTMALRNPDSAVIHLKNELLRAEAKQGDRWINIRNVWTGSGMLMPNGKSVVLLQVPSETEACRISFEYSPATLKERLRSLRQAHQLPSSPVTSLIDQWLWPAQAPGWMPPARQWTEASSVVSTPQELGKGDD